MLSRIKNRTPDVIIGGANNPYLLRWFVIPRNRFFNIYLHRFCRSDDDRALHDHPWLFNISILLSGSYLEVTKKGLKMLVEGQWKFRFGNSPHRVQLFLQENYEKEEPVDTLFITGPKIREWGFLCPKGWRHWRDFTAGPNGETVGKGCD